MKFKALTHHHSRGVIIGTIRKHKWEIPPLSVSIKNRSIFGSYFGFSKNKTLVFYKVNKNKVVVLLSSIVKDVYNSTSEKRKPEIITAYNSTKRYVDTSDWIVENYSIVKKSAK